MSWYKTGEEARKALEKAEQISQLLREKNVPRFRLRKDEKADVIFVDDKGFWCEIHIVKIGNRWVELTCSSGIRACPICMRETRRPLGVTFFTVIDLRQYTKRDGTVVKYSKVLLPARRTLAKQIFEFKEKYGSLRGLRFTLKRYTDNDPACGIIVGEAHRDATGKLKRYNISALGKEYATPFDYEKVLAPPTDEELRVLGFDIAVVGDTPLEESEEELIPEELVEEEVEEEEPELEEEIEEGEEIEEEEEPELEEEEVDEEDMEEELEKIEDEVDELPLEEEEEEKPKKKVRRKKK